MAVLKVIVSLYSAGEKKPIKRHTTRVKVTEENKLFSSFQKILSSFFFSFSASDSQLGCASDYLLIANSGS